MKKRISVLIVLCLLFALLPPIARANTDAVVASGTCGKAGSDLSWSLSTDGILTFSGSGDMCDYKAGTAPWNVYRDEIKQVILPEGLTGIGAWAFADCGALTKIDIPASVAVIGDSTFLYCDSLTAIRVADGNRFYSSDASGVLFDREKTLLVQAPTAISGYYAVPDGVVRIGASAFDCCDGLTSVSLAESVTSIDVGAFFGCIALKELSIPNGVTQIGDFAFYNCVALNAVAFGSCVSHIGEYAFGFCLGLTELTFPASLSYIGNAAFSGCTALTDVYFRGDAPQTGENIFRLYTATGLLEGNEYITLYHLANASGWTASWNGYFTATWDGNAPHTHSYKSEVTAPTCTERGYTTYTCGCGKTYRTDYTEALGHDYKDGECTRCGATDPNYAPPHTHSYRAEVVTPTCTEKGYSVYTCACGESYRDNYTDALGHNYKNGECSRCGATDPNCAPPHTHSYSKEVVTPTCTQKGYTVYTCDCGESYRDDYTDALGHDYDHGECTRCGANDPDYVIPSANFKDVANDAWYKSAVDYAVDKGLMNGMGNNTFEPDTPTNRAMLVTVLWRYAGSPVDGRNTFSDVPNGQWYTQAVAWAAKNGIVSGMGNNKFEPDGTLTREQLATILFRYAKLQNLDTSARADFSKFEDGKKVQSWSKDAMQWAVAEGIIGGTSENGKLYLDPQGNATRAQVATILMRFIENVLKK